MDLGGWKTTSWNPTTGCEDRYALTFAARLKDKGQPKYQDDGDPRTSGPGFALTLPPGVVDAPRHWRTPRHVFVDSMSDLFHARVPLGFIRQVVETMRETPQHTYQVLTKRTQRMATLSQEIQWPSNVWVGTSVEDARVLHRAEDLRRVDAKVRFLSLEPLLGPLPDLDLDGMDWVSVAGETGPGARMMDAGWVRQIRDRCAARGVPFFFMGWGSATRGGRGVLDGRTWDQMPAAGSATRPGAPTPPSPVPAAVLLPADAAGSLQGAGR